MKKEYSMLVLIMFFSVVLANVVNALEPCEDTSLIWTVGNPQVVPSEIRAGGTIQVSVSITNGAQNTAYDCTMTVAGKSIQKTVQPQGTEQLSLSLTAPSYHTTSQKTETLSILLACTGVWDKPWPISDCTVTADMTKSASYKWPTCGDGFCDAGERCDNCVADCKCAANQVCVDGSCSLCGNGRVDSGENCKTCPTDNSCATGTYCSDSGKCEECLVDEHCKLTPVPIPGENQYCSADYHNLITESQYTIEECQSNRCVAVTKTDKKETVCKEGICQDNHCGCSEGYSECQSAGKCTKLREFKLNDPCSCDFQCKSDFCYHGKCSRGVTTTIHTQQKQAQVGEEVTISLALTNELSEDIRAQLIFEVPSGVQLTFSKGAQECSGAQCSTYVEIPGKGSDAIEVEVMATGKGTLPLKGKISFDYDNQAHIVPLQSQEISFTECNDNICDSQYGETRENCCYDCDSTESTLLLEYSCVNETTLGRSFTLQFYLGILGIIIIGLVGYFGVPRWYRSSKQKREEQKEQKEKKKKKKMPAPQK